MKNSMPWGIALYITIAVSSFIGSVIGVVTTIMTIEWFLKP